MASTIVTFEIMVTNVINKGAIQVKTDYCSEFWLNVNTDDNEMEVEIEEEESEMGRIFPWDKFWWMKKF